VLRAKTLSVPSRQDRFRPYGLIWVAWLWVEQMA
jgi:hypothetical protein